MAKKWCVRPSTLEKRREFVGVNKKALKTILEEYGASHLGYFVALNILGPRNPGRMSEVCRLSVNQCRNIEKDLVELGVIETEGIGRGRKVTIVDSGPSEQGLAILDRVAQLQGRSSFARSEWFDRQLLIAEDLIKDFGFQAVMWMVEYTIKVKELKLYSLNLIYALAHELIPKYNKALQAAEAVKTKEERGAVINLDKVLMEKEQENQQISSDVSDIKMNFGIEF